ncbi:MAG: hypothetical protein JWM49_1129 [Microbacteriaceae bacterium]|jgi:hypothetical protein|nr:hypothetical protein [Microbacteriaceae bacterium]
MAETLELRRGRPNFIDGVNVVVIATQPGQLLLAVGRDAGLERDIVTVASGAPIGRLTHWTVGSLNPAGGSGDPELAAILVPADMAA